MKEPITSTPVSGLSAAELQLLDSFAAAAITGIMANPERWKQIAKDYKKGRKTYEQCSESNAVKAYNIAWAMLNEHRRQVVMVGSPNNAN
jgi:hypothetical protein